MSTIHRVFLTVWLIFAMTPAALAGACRCDPPQSSLDEAIAASDHVFRAVVVGAEVIRERNGFATEIYVGETIPLKGAKPDFYKMVSPLPRACGVVVSVPQEYWFFTDAKGVITPCSRSAPASAAEMATLETRIRDALAASRNSDYDAEGFARPPSGLLAVPYLAAGATTLLFVLLILWLNRRSWGRRKS